MGPYNIQPLPSLSDTYGPVKPVPLSEHCTFEGPLEGVRVGFPVVKTVGTRVGGKVGSTVGRREGRVLGSCVGETLGPWVGGSAITERQIKGQEDVSE